jgi:hypothetical protein
VLLVLKALKRQDHGEQRFSYGQGAASQGCGSLMTDLQSTAKEPANAKPYLNVQASESYSDPEQIYPLVKSSQPLPLTLPGFSKRPETAIRPDSY